MLCWELCMLLPTYNSCEETYTVCAAAPVLMSLRTSYLYYAIYLQRCEVVGGEGKRWLCSH